MTAQEKPRLSGDRAAAENDIDCRRNHTASDLFPETVPVRKISLPKPGTLKHLALLALLAGPVRQCDFTESWRLAAYTKMLRDDGYSVLSRTVAWAGREIAEYRLDLSDQVTADAVRAMQRGRK